MSTMATTKKDAILSLFRASAEPLSCEALTAKALAAEVWNEEERERFAIRGAQGTVRRILNDIGEDGCPNSMIRFETVADEETGARKVQLYVQPSLFTVDDARTWITHRVAQLRDDHDKIRAFLDYATTRWPDARLEALVPALPFD